MKKYIVLILLLMSANLSAVMQVTASTFFSAQTALNTITAEKNYPWISVNAKTGLLDATVCQTTAWDTVKKVDKEEKWYFTKPEDKYLTNIVNCIQEEFDQIWVAVGI